MASTRRSRRAFRAVCVVTALVATHAVAPVSAADEQTYLVVADSSVVGHAESVLPRSARASAASFVAVDAAVAQMTAAQAEAVDAQPGVVVSPDGWMTLQAGAAPAADAAPGRGDPAGPAAADMQARLLAAASTWGLDRLDQRSLPLNGRYTRNGGVDGRGVHVYVIDSGIDMDHPEFAGRVSTSWSLADDGRGADDVNGHGTHVAGTIGSTIFGIAPAVTLHSVRVLDESGAATFSEFVAAMDLVAAKAIRPAVVNVSLGGPYNAAVNQAVANLVRAGIPVVVAAGNDGESADRYSPGSTPSAITVAASNAADRAASFSNHGRSVDLFAPGVEIDSTNAGAPRSSSRDSGTSMAAPHVTGWVALYLQHHRNASPATIRRALIGTATRGRIANEVGGTPDRLPYTSAVKAAATRTPAKKPSITVTAPKKAKVRVDVDPDRKAQGYWKVKVLKRVDGSYVRARTVRTKGAAEVAVVDVPRGRYVVRVPAQHGFAATTSRSVVLKR